MKTRKETVLGKRLVQGDPNLVTKDEILVKEVGNEVKLYERSDNGKLVLLTPESNKPAPKDYLEVYWANFSCHMNPGNMVPTDTAYHIVIDAPPLKRNGKNIQYFLFSFPFWGDYSLDEGEVAVLTRLRTVDNSHLLELQELNKIHNIQDVLNIITKDAFVEDLDTANYIPSIIRQKSRGILGLIKLTANTDDYHILDANLEFLPAFTQKEELEEQKSLLDGSFREWRWKANFKIKNIDNQVRTFLAEEMCYVDGTVIAGSIGPTYLQSIRQAIIKNKEVYVGEVPANGGRHEVDNGVIQHAKYLFTRNTYVVNQAYKSRQTPVSQEDFRRYFIKNISPHKILTK